MILLVATPSQVLQIRPDSGTAVQGEGLGRERPTGLSSGLVGNRAWCCTDRGGVFRTDNGGESWEATGLDGEKLMSVAVSPSDPNRVWAGAEPSVLWRSDDAGVGWGPTSDLEALPSSSDWSFPPKPETHHVRWIGCHPADADRLWIAIEAGALVRTFDGGRTWVDRVSGGPWDTHELAVHAAAPEVLRVSAGDGYFESFDGGESWESPEEGLEIGYLRSVAIDPGDPDVVIVSAASGPRSAYVSGRSDGRVYRREGNRQWQRVIKGWPDRPSTIAPLLQKGTTAGELWAADERGVHRSEDGGRSWDQVHAFEIAPDHLRGLAVLGG